MIMKKIFTVYQFIQLFLCGVEPFKYRPTVSQNSTLIITDNMLVSITKGVGVPF